MVAEADVEAPSATDAARWLYWRLRTSGVVSSQSGGLLNVAATDQQRRHHDTSIDAVIFQDDRFFHATAAAGRLHLSDIPDDGPWEPTRITYTRDRKASELAAVKVRSVPELDTQIKSARDRSQPVSLWVHEDLLDVAHNRWASGSPIMVVRRAAVTVVAGG